MKDKFFAVFMLFTIAILLILPTAKAFHQGESNLNETCSVGDNLTTIPSPNSNFTIAVASNTSLSFLFSIIVSGECSAFNISIQTNCIWCGFSSNRFDNLSHGTNTQINTNVFVPALPENFTNKTYSYHVAITSDTSIAKAFGLAVFVPFTNQFNNVTLELNRTNLTLQNITDIISQLDQQDQLKLALILSQVFGQNFNFSFVIRTTDVIERQVPVITPIPLNVQEYVKWSQSCNPLVYEQAVETSKEANQKYMEVVNRTYIQDAIIRDTKEDLRVCRERLELQKEKENETITLAVSGSKQQEESAYTTLVIVTMIVFAGAVLLYLRTTYGFPFKHKKPFVPLKFVESESKKNQEEDTKANIMGRLKDKLPKKESKKEEIVKEERQKTEEKDLIADKLHDIVKKLLGD